MGTIFGREPALILGAIAAGINLLLLLHVVILDADQIAALNIFAAAIVGLLVRQAVTPVSSPRLDAGTQVQTPQGPAVVRPV